MANQPNSLGYNLETWVSQMLREGGVIPDAFQILHESDTDRADKDRIIVSATVGEQDYGGSRPWNVAIEIDLSTVTPDQATFETYVASIEDVMSTWPEVDAGALFEDVWPLPPEAEEKSASQNTRHRTRTYNVLAVEAADLPFAPASQLAFVPAGDLMFA